MNINMPHDQRSQTAYIKPNSQHTKWFFSSGISSKNCWGKVHLTWQ